MYATVDERILIKRLLGERLQKRIDAIDRNIKRVAGKKNRSGSLKKLADMRKERAELGRELKNLNVVAVLLYSDARSKKIVEAVNKMTGYKSTQLEQLALESASISRHVCIHDRLKATPGGDKPGSPLLLELDDFAL